jgi:hypothetical protein
MNYTILPGGKRARLLQPHYFKIEGQWVFIPAGYQWDGATGPSRLLRTFLGLNRFGAHDQATAEHDFVYEKEGNLDQGGKKISRKASDELFIRRLAAIKWKGKRLDLARLGVRFFGFFYWREI